MPTRQTLPEGAVARRAPKWGTRPMAATAYTTQSEALQKALSLSTTCHRYHFCPRSTGGCARISGRTAPGRRGRTHRQSLRGLRILGKAAQSTFTTQPDDHANCNVGSYTHGLKTLEEAAQGSDVATLLETGWITAQDVPKIPRSQKNFPSLPTAHWPRRPLCRMWCFSISIQSKP